MKATVDIKEVHNAIVELEDVPEGATREQILNLARGQFEERGEDVLEYDHTLEEGVWTVRDEEGNFL